MPKEKTSFIGNVLAVKTVAHQVGDYIEFWLNNRTRCTWQKFLYKMTPASED